MCKHRTKQREICLGGASLRFLKYPSDLKHILVALCCMSNEHILHLMTSAIAAGAWQRSAFFIWEIKEREDLHLKEGCEIYRDKKCLDITDRCKCRFKFVQCKYQEKNIVSYMPRISLKIKSTMWFNKL